MILRDSKQIHTNILSFFGTGTLAEQINALLNLNIQGMYDDFNDFDKLDKQIPIIYAVGYKDLQKKRTRLKELLAEGYNICSFVADNAILSPESKVGNGVIIHQGVIIDNFVNLCNGVFINIGATVSHHTTLEECVFVGPGATIAGNVEIGSNVFIGAGSTIIDGVKIGEGSLIGAGAVVIEDVPPFTLVAGVPAKMKKKL